MISHDPSFPYFSQKAEHHCILFSHITYQFPDLLDHRFITEKDRSGWRLPVSGQGRIRRGQRSACFDSRKGVQAKTSLRISALKTKNFHQDQGPSKQRLKINSVNLSQISTYLILNVRSKRRLAVKRVPWGPPLALSGSRVPKIIPIYFSWHTHPKGRDRSFKTFCFQVTMNQLTFPIPLHSQLTRQLSGMN